MLHLKNIMKLLKKYKKILELMKAEGGTAFWEEEKQK